MDATEKRQLETQLVKMGLAGLDPQGEPTGELIQQIAGIVNSWPGHFNRHGEWIDRDKFLRDLLSECDEDKRNEMYTALKPHLLFPVQPLAHYEAMMTDRINALVSKRAARVEGAAPRPMLVGDRDAIRRADAKRFAKRQKRARQSLQAGEIYVAESDAQNATHIMATLRCYQCSRSQEFLGDTPAGAMIAGRKAGWMRNMVLNKEVCPACVKKAAA